MWRAGVLDDLQRVVFPRCVAAHTIISCSNGIMADEKTQPVVFTPDSEPYLGRGSLYRLDVTIVEALRANQATAELSHRGPLTDLQRAACQILPQGVSIALSIRELIRQGYLFSAFILLRPLIERALPDLVWAC